MSERPIDRCIAQKRAKRIGLLHVRDLLQGKMMRDAFESKAFTGRGVMVAQRAVGVCIPALSGISLMHQLS